MKKARRKIEELNLLDDFLFYEVVSGERGEDFCRLLIKAVCGRDVGCIRVRPQNVIQGTDTENRGVRMDLYVEEEGQRLYDFEPDKYTSREVLPKRNRYYRALLDGKILSTGEKFELLPEVWTIFILPYDPFGRNRMCYTVQNNIQEEPDVEYKDGAVSLFLYTEGEYDENVELAQLLHYIAHSTAQNAVNDELKKLHKYVTAIKNRREVGVRYMKSWELEQMWRREAREEGLEEGRREGRREGHQEGRQEGKKQSIIDLLSYIENVPEDLKEKINCETNPDMLTKWHKLAAKSESILDFKQRMS